MSKEYNFLLWIPTYCESMKFYGHFLLFTFELLEAGWLTPALSYIYFLFTLILLSLLLLLKAALLPGDKLFFQLFALCVENCIGREGNTAYL